MSDELYLTDLIDVNVLQKLQDAFSEMTGMASITTDITGLPVTEPSNFSDFCYKYTRESPLGNSRCMRCDKTGAELTMQSKKACTYYCHAGLMDFAAPIMMGDKMVGSFVGGQVLPTEPNLDEMRNIAVELGIDPDEYVEAAKKINVLSPEMINKAANFIFIIAESLSFLAVQAYELHKSNVEIEKASRMKSDFLANMSHEIRTPMNAVMGMVDLALREEMSPTAKEYMHQIKSSAKNLLVIINDILDFSKIESGKMDIINVAYEPLSVINDLSGIANSRIGTKDIEFIIDISPDMPQMIFGDNVRIHQILLNLITNAVKFTKQGEVRLTIDYDRQSDEMVIMKASVSDTGIGIKKTEADKLFNSFQQVDSKRNKNIEGTGLGLAISKQLLALMGGSISVKSEYGKGSVFSFEVPQKIIDKTPAIPSIEKKYRVGVLVTNGYVRTQLIRDCKKIGADVTVLNNVEHFDSKNYDYTIIEKPFFTQSMKSFFERNPDAKCIIVCNFDSPNNITLPNVKQLHKPVYSLNLYNAMGISDYQMNTSAGEVDSFTFVAPDAKVLIVDDNQVNLTVAKGLIEPVNMQVDTAISASEAIKMVSKTKYDIIFMDHMMPEVDGIEATRIIRRMLPSYNETPIIALTANAIGGAREMFLREGMNDFVAKPIEINDIVSKLRKWLPQDKILPAEKTDADASDGGTELDIKNIPGFNTEKAISMLGSEKLYMSVLKEYYSAIDNNARSIQNHRFKEEWDQYTIEVHALKSTSRQVGAEELGELAYEMEMAGKEGKIDLIKEKTDHLLDMYMKCKDTLSPYFPDVQKEQEEYADKDRVAGFLDRMTDALNAFDILQIEDVIDEMDKYKYHTECSEHFKKLKQSVKEGDMDGCFKVIEEWRSCLEHCELFHEMPAEVMYSMLDSLMDALNNFDTLRIDEAVSEMAKNKYPDDQQALLEQLQEYAKISDIDNCCEVVAQWRALIS